VKLKRFDLWPDLSQCLILRLATILKCVGGLVLVEGFVVMELGNLGRLVVDGGGLVAAEPDARVGGLIEASLVAWTELVLHCVAHSVWSVV
jgi:hypothetical protein